MSRACAVCEREGLRLFLHRDRCYCLWHLPFDQLPPHSRAYILRERSQDVQQRACATRTLIQSFREREKSG